jgi:hypothetical protein
MTVKDFVQQYVSLCNCIERTSSAGDVTGSCNATHVAADYEGQVAGLQSANQCGPVTRTSRPWSHVENFMGQHGGAWDGLSRQARRASYLGGRAAIHLLRVMVCGDMADGTPIARMQQREHLKVISCEDPVVAVAGQSSRTNVIAGHSFLRNWVVDVCGLRHGCFTSRRGRPWYPIAPKYVPNCRIRRRCLTGSGRSNPRGPCT